MDELMQQMDHLERTANLSASIQDVERAIDLLNDARAKIASRSFTRDFLATMY